MPGDTTIERRPPSLVAGTFAEGMPSDLPAPQAPQPGPSYYDLSMLKPPVWGTEVSLYFFLGGLSAGAYVLARLAERFGGERYRLVRRAGTAVAALAALPCAPLLIADLGDPKRFHHMLRVFKPRSPMNLGAWTLTAYSGAAALAVLREWRLGRSEAEQTAASKVIDGVLLAVTDAAGVPLALLLAGYTGVLLSSTATPVWTQNKWLGSLFTAGAFSSGTTAVRLALGLWRLLTGDGPDEGVTATLERVQTAGHFGEALTLAGFLSAAGHFAEPLTRGRLSAPLWGSVLGMAVSEGLKLLPLRGRARGWAELAADVLGLVGAFGVRWAMVHAGPPSARDPDAARASSRAGD